MAFAVKGDEAFDPALLGAVGVSRIRHYLVGFDEVVRESDEDFEQSGLKVTSVIRAGRLAVVSGDILLGAIA